MTSGIYKLTFPSGNFYIGKSNDIEKRWKQHLDKFNAGKHTKLMQPEFDLYRDYDQEVLIYAHEDHIDILEETFIARLTPPLNGTKGKDRLYIAPEHEDIFLSYFSMSTLEHIALAHNTKNEVSELKDKISEMNTDAELAKIDFMDQADSYIETIDTLRKARSKEELQADISNRISSLTAGIVAANRTISGLNNEVNKLIKENYELWKYKKLPWYKKIFA